MISIRTSVAALFAMIAALLVALGYIATLQVGTATRQAGAEIRRHDSIRLAEDMRQSSNDLTSMVRLYAATGESRYRAIYDEILAIRNGDAPRPVHYDGSFWDRVLVHGKAGVALGPPKSLLALMREAQFSAAEFAALESSRQASDALAKTEIEVMGNVAARVAAGVDAQYFNDISRTIAGSSTMTTIGTRTPSPRPSSAPKHWSTSAREVKWTRCAPARTN